MILPFEQRLLFVSRRAAVLSFGCTFLMLTCVTPTLAAQEPSCHEVAEGEAVTEAKEVAVNGHQGHQGHSMAKDSTSDVPSPRRHLEIPDIELVDQDGEPVRFYSELIANRQVVVNFVFTTCTTICPPMGASFGRMQDLLGERFGEDVFLVSVSVDPVVDTPERLKAWAEKFGRRDGWTLVTGKRDDVNQVLRSLGAFTGDKIDHAPLALVGNDAAGLWQRVYGLAPPQTIVSTLDELGIGDESSVREGR